MTVRTVIGTFVRLDCPGCLAFLVWPAATLKIDDERWFMARHRRCEEPKR